MLITERKLKNIINNYLFESSTIKIKQIQQIMHAPSSKDGAKLGDGTWGEKTDAAWYDWSGNIEVMTAAQTIFDRSGKELSPDQPGPMIIMGSANTADVRKLFKGVIDGRGALDFVHKFCFAIEEELKATGKEYKRFESDPVVQQPDDINVGDGLGIDDIQFSSKPLSPVGRKIIDAYPKSAHIAAEIEEVSKRLDMNPYHLANLIHFESAGSFSPSKDNMAGSGAVGLIQFMPSTAEGLGTTTSALRRMTGPEQMVYVEKYLNDIKKYTGADLQKAEDLAMSVFFPTAVGKGRSYNIYEYYVRRFNKVITKKFTSGFIKRKSNKKGVKKYGFTTEMSMNPEGTRARAEEIADTVFRLPNGGIETAGDYVDAKYKSARLPTENINPYDLLNQQELEQRLRFT